MEQTDDLTSNSVWTLQATSLGSRKVTYIFQVLKLSPLSPTHASQTGAAPTKRKQKDNRCQGGFDYRSIAMYKRRFRIPAYRTTSASSLHLLTDIHILYVHLEILRLTFSQKANPASYFAIQIAPDKIHSSINFHPVPDRPKLAGLQLQSLSKGARQVRMKRGPGLGHMPGTILLRCVIAENVSLCYLQFNSKVISRE